ncbi:MAG: hypothetical protein MK078_07620 [Crocinitomicaceae bacterium]|nr:hypothetical protein [Crocinitomicaceae bacterium]
MFDNYMNTGSIYLGLNLYYNRILMGVSCGLEVWEERQDLLYEIRSYAAFLPGLRLRFGVNFDR